MMLCDAHCHLANLSQMMPLKPLLEESLSQGISHYLSSALCKEDLEYYAQNRDQKGICLRYSAGIHPSFDECDLELADLRRLCEEKLVWAIGEIGLDRNNPDKQEMQDTFIRQLELARSYSLPVVLHIVGHQQEAYNILSRYPLRYLMHGYAGSVEAFQSFLKLDCYFTISERILREDKRMLLKAMLDSGRYLFETDITRYYVQEGEHNPLLRLKNVIARSAELSGIPVDTLTKEQAINCKRLTGYDL
ncbi:MAG: TatD family hydrolase [Candidatus Cloacimonetes bacterium]|jgi:TatD DNase family protein|nr:TatD family hydrolase [Candidatus Cloacimonadota bacterium]MDD2506458.1 TatD family hydrolase [Candidatus Cloacimonadota bacterium]MDD4559998.1 TatD family hydrolase [Candidatus Cloacimonadota bacterium]